MLLTGCSFEPTPTEEYLGFCMKMVDGPTIQFNGDHVYHTSGGWVEIKKNNGRGWYVKIAAYPSSTIKRIGSCDREDDIEMD